MRLLRGSLVVILVALACGQTAASANVPVRVEDVVAPAEPVSRDFPPDVLARLPHDAQYERAALKFWSDPRIGGWGGTQAGESACPVGHVARTPVVFVHGTSEDAEFWRTADSGDGTIVDVRQRFLDAGYCPEELWAVSYDGAPGYFTYNEINAEEVLAFIRIVKDYTHAARVDVVAHSLGVTVIRYAALIHPELTEWMHAFVAIAGANHGTTTCRGLGDVNGSEVCEEVTPGDAWLAALNGPAGDNETPRTADWKPFYATIYEGTGLADTFYLGPDAQSPDLKGADCHHQMPLVAHNTLGHGDAAVRYYLAYLQELVCR